MTTLVEKACAEADERAETDIGRRAASHTDDDVGATGIECGRDRLAEPDRVGVQGP